MRIMHESSLYENNAFLTLTYSDENLPEHETLVKSHHRVFMDKMRKSYGYGKLRYYHCGEYGDQTHRPHYHSILFNVEFEDRKFLKTTESGEKLYTSEKLDAVWSHGDCYIGDVTFESAAYCARYVMKKLTGARKSEYGSREPEYSTMSRRPGIGAPWLAKWKRDVFPHDFCVINGKKVRVPKAYDQLLIKKETPSGKFLDDPYGDKKWKIFYPDLKRTEMETVKAKRIRNAAKHSENQTRERLDVIEELTELRVQRLTRNEK